MINILFQYTGNVYEAIPGYETNLFRADDIVNGWCLVLDNPDDFDQIELDLEASGDVFVIGTYNEDGSQYIWGNEVSRNHTPEKYVNGLHPDWLVTGYNEDGSPVLQALPYDGVSGLTVQAALPPGFSERVLT